MSDSVRLIVGVDWATREHQVCVMDPEGVVLQEKSFEHSGDGLADLVGCLDRLSEGQLEEVRVAIEVPHGAVVDTLMERGCEVFAINPKQLDRFRDRHTVAGAKDDRRDAYVLADSLRTDAHLFRHLSAVAPEVIELREWSRMDEELKRERVRLCNQLREQLRRYFPQTLELTSEVSERWFLKLLKRVPTPETARKVKAQSIAPILKSHRIRRISATQVLRTLTKRPLSLAAGTVEAASAHVGLLIERLQLANEQIRNCQKQLDTLLESLTTIRQEEENSGHEEGWEKGQRSAAILRSLPGVGTIVLATLLAEAPHAVREADYHMLRSLAGVAPVTKQTGNSRRVVMRRACNARVRNACYHWARCATQNDAASRAQYANLRARGKSHGRALRSVADRLLRIASSMLRHGTFYNPLHAPYKAA